jgi:hypothetical protein
MIFALSVLCYLAAGTLAVFICTFLFRERDKRRGPIKNIFELVIPFSVALLIWPLFVYFVAESALSERRRRRDPAFAERPPFSVGLEDLGETLSMEDIEARERLVDPLGAVPDRPFGHLNPAWERFKAGMSPGARLAPFSSLYKTYSVVRYSGYAEVSSGAPSSWFISSVRRVE